MEAKKETPCGVTYAALLGEARLERFAPAFKEAGLNVESDAAAWLRKEDLMDEAQLFAKVGLKRGHIARLCRAWSDNKAKLGLGVPAEEVEEQDRLWALSIVPFATLLSSMDTKEMPAIKAWLKGATDKALEIKKVFQEIDTNKDNVLDKSEFKTGLERILKRADVWLVKYVKYMDKAAPKTLPKAERQWLSSATQYLEKHYDSKIHPKVVESNEMKALFADPKKLEASFDKCDTNKDGRLDMREFMGNVLFLLFSIIDDLVLKQIKQDVESKESKDSSDSEIERISELEVMTNIPEVMVNRFPSLEQPSKLQIIRPRVMPNRPRPKVMPNRPLRVMPNIRVMPKKELKNPELQIMRNVRPQLKPQLQIMRNVRPSPPSPPSNSSKEDDELRVRDFPLPDFPFPIRTLAPDILQIQRKYGREFHLKLGGEGKNTQSKSASLSAPVLSKIRGKVGASDPAIDWATHEPLKDPLKQMMMVDNEAGPKRETKPKHVEVKQTKACGKGERKYPGDAKLSKEAKTKLRDAWLHQAKCEHASVASFANHTIELMKFGAPAEYVHSALVAAQDEVRHTRTCFRLAARFDPDGEVFAPDAFPVGNNAVISETLEDMAVKMAMEGCYGETMGTIYGARQLLTVKDDEIKAAILEIISEECTHALLAWNACKWAVQKGGKPVLMAVVGALKRAIARVEFGIVNEGLAKETGSNLLNEKVKKQRAEEQKAQRMEEIWSHYGVLTSKTMRGVEAKQGKEVVTRLLNALTKWHEDTEKKVGAKWNPAAIIADVVNKLAERTVILPNNSQNN